MTMRSTAANGAALRTRARAGVASALACSATLICLAVLVSLPAASQAAEIVDAKIAFVPYKLGASTTITSNVKISTVNGEVPPPLVKIELQFPKSLSLISSNLGLAICDARNLEDEGQTGCSPNSRIGTGTAHVAVPFGPEIVNEATDMIAYMGAPVHEGVTMILYGEGRTPVYAQMLLQGSLVAGDGPFNELLLTSNLPLIPTLPGAKDVSMISMQLTLGPRSLKYYKRVHGRTVSFHPRGLVLPPACPGGGFPFTSTLTFQDGFVRHINVVVPCPKRKRKH